LNSFSWPFSDTVRYVIGFVAETAAECCLFLLDNPSHLAWLPVKGREAVHFTLDWQTGLMYSGFMMQLR
jgi:hypothetical protein